VVEYTDGILLWGWRRDPEPIGLDLSGAAEEWTATLEAEGRTLANLARPFRDRVDTALEWMEVASRERSWKVKIPAIFSAIEALLVPEDCSHKAEVVTVRAMALQITLHERFSSPAETYHAYLLRCDLVHGSPVGSDFPEERLRFAEGREWWAQEIISAYVTHASRAGAKTALELVRALDQSQASEQARTWLRKVGGDQVVHDYQQAVGLRDEEASPASTDSGAA
jgi:hypothetical protein